MEQAGCRRAQDAVDAGAAFLEGFEDDGAPGEVEALGCERQGLGEAAAGVEEHEGEGSDLARGFVWPR